MPNRKSRAKKRLATAAFLAGSGAALAMAASGTASADDVVNDAAAAPSDPTIVSIAQAQLANPKNRTFYSDGAYEAWCADFVSWVMNQSGNPVRSGYWRVPSVYGLQQAFTNQGMYEGRGYVPKPGDTVLYGESHTNIVVAVNGDSITTIGGNEANGRISQRTISRHNGIITGYGRTSQFDQPVTPSEEIITDSGPEQPEDALPPDPDNDLPPASENVPPPAEEEDMEIPQEGPPPEPEADVVPLDAPVPDQEPPVDNPVDNDAAPEPVEEEIPPPPAPWELPPAPAGEPEPSPLP